MQTRLRHQLGYAVAAGVVEAAAADGAGVASIVSKIFCR
jgi:hypothetical protein